MSVQISIDDQYRGRGRRPLPKPLIYRERDLNALTRMSRTAREVAMKAGTFPKPLQLSTNSRGWLASEIDEWLADRIAQRDGPDARSDEAA